MWGIGIDLGGTKIEALALSPDGVERNRVRIPAPQGDYGATLEAIVWVAGIARKGLPDKEITGIGIGIPGSLSPKTGLLRNANSPWLNGQPLLRDLEPRFELPVAIENDANCFTLSEAADGAGQGYRTVFGVILGTGVGGGIVIDGRVLLGRSAIGGEWGHNALPWPDADETAEPAHLCKKRATIETFLSGPALERQYQALSGQKAEAKAIAERAANGEEAARTVLSTYVRRLAKSLAVAVNIVDPDVIVFGGGLSNIPGLIGMAAAQLPEWVVSDYFDTPLKINRWGDSSGVKGAARLLCPRGPA
jgi:fructokinase